MVGKLSSIVCTYKYSEFIDIKHRSRNGKMKLMSCRIRPMHAALINERLSIYKSHLNECEEKWELLQSKLWGFATDAITTYKIQRRGHAQNARGCLLLGCFETILISKGDWERKKVALLMQAAETASVRRMQPASQNCHSSEREEAIHAEKMDRESDNVRRFSWIFRIESSANAPCLFSYVPLLGVFITSQKYHCSIKSTWCI
jgi:hypothetical protein